MSNQSARPLSAEDQAILALESPVVAGHTCKVVLVDGDIDADRLRSAIAARLPGAPALSLRLGERNGAPWWIPDPDIDLAAHVVSAGDSAAFHDKTSLPEAVAGVFAQRLDRTRPLWRIDVISGLPDGGTALAWRIHHALADGSTAMHLAETVLWNEEPGPATTALTATTARAIRMASPANLPSPARDTGHRLGGAAHRGQGGTSPLAALAVRRPDRRAPVGRVRDGRPG